MPTVLAEAFVQRTFDTFNKIDVITTSMTNVKVCNMCNFSTFLRLSLRVQLVETKKNTHVYLAVSVGTIPALSALSSA